MTEIEQIKTIATNPQQNLDKLYAILLAGNFADIKAWLEQRKVIEAALNLQDCSLELVLAIICTEKVSSALEFIATINQNLNQDNFLQYLARRNLEIPASAEQNTIWHWLAKGGHYEQLKQAIELQLFNPNIMFAVSGYAVWHVLALYDHIDELLFAIDDGLFNPETLKDKHGKTVWDLLPKETMEQLGFERANTIYHLLALRGHYKRLLAAINLGKFNHRTLTNRRGSTVWHYLAMGGHYEELCLAIEAGYFDPASLVTVSRHTVWHCLAMSGRIDEILLSIEQKKFDLAILNQTSGIDLWSLVPGNAWINMIRNNRIDELRKMIALGYCKPEHVKNPKNNASIWHYYALYGHTRELLIAINANLFNPSILFDKNNLTVWHYLVCGGFIAKLNLIYVSFPHLFRTLKMEQILAKLPGANKIIKSKYTPDPSPIVFTKGKNKKSLIVISESKQDRRRKHWVEKPLIEDVYDLNDAVDEVFFGQLAVKIFGKEKAPKTKFNLGNASIVSRVIRNDKCLMNDLNNIYDHKYIKITPNAQMLLIKFLCFGVLINDRDISSRNIVVQYAKKDNQTIIESAYSIDHEFVNYNIERLISFKEFFKACYSDRKILTDVIITNSANWTAFKEAFTGTRKRETDAFNARLFDAVTNEDVQKIFAELAEKISSDEFRICNDTKQEIYDHLAKTGSIYYPYFVERLIMPKIDKLITILKDNISFCIKHMQEPRKVSCKC